MRGFTIIELIVVAAIIAILAAGAAYSFRQSERPVDLERVANKVVNDLRDMQNRALAGERCAMAGCNNNVPYGGYGVQFRSDLVDVWYTTFADFQIPQSVSNCNEWQTTENTGGYTTVGQELIRTTTYSELSASGDLHSDIFLKDSAGASLTCSGSTCDVAHVVFLPANGGVAMKARNSWIYTCSVHTSGGQMVIRVRRGSSGSCTTQGQCMCIVIKTSGEITLDKNYTCS